MDYIIRGPVKFTMCHDEHFMYISEQICGERWDGGLPIDELERIEFSDKYGALFNNLHLFKEFSLFDYKLYRYDGT